MANEERVREIAKVIDPAAFSFPDFPDARSTKQVLAMDKARAIAALSVPVPAGWKTVPVEPTEKMREALWYGMFPSDAPPENEAVLIGHAYDAMLAASPPAPASQVLTEDMALECAAMVDPEAYDTGHKFYDTPGAGEQRQRALRVVFAILDRLTNKDAEHG